MRLKLKEEPKEWLKFTAVITLALGIAGTLLYVRKVIDQRALFGGLALLAMMLALCWIRPQWFRGFYRGGMTLSFHVGQIMGKLMLTVFFILVVTPLGLFLRLLGKDLLKLRRDPSASSYWRPARTNNQFDRLF